MVFAVVQRGGTPTGTSASSMSLSQSTASGSLLVVCAVSNNPVFAATAGAYAMVPGGWTAGHNGDYTGIFFLANTPAGIGSISVPLAYAISYLEVTGASTFAGPVVARSQYGSSSNGTSFTLPNPGASTSYFTVFALGYDSSNGGTAIADGTGNQALMSAYGQYSWTTGSGGLSGTFSSRTYDGCGVSFYPSGSGSGGTASPTAALSAAAVPDGVYRGPCGTYTQNGFTSTAQAGVKAYASWLGRPVAYVLDYLAEAPASWTAFENGTLDNTGYAGFTTLNSWGALPAGQTMVIGLSPCAGKSIGTGGSTWAAEASGTNDAHWTALGNNLIAWGYGSAVLRIGREFNGNWYNWAPGNTGDSAANYIAGYQHIVTLLKGLTGAHFKFMWNPSVASSPGGSGIMENGSAQSFSGATAEVQNWYPGGSYVDYIGLDLYDWGTYSSQASTPYGGRTAAQQLANFTAAVAGQDGLNSWAAFAAANSKPLAFPEWGLQLWLTGGHYIGGGDDPYFITAMSTVVGPAALQSMWEDLGEGLFDTDSCPRRTTGLAPDSSRTRFLALFGISSSSTGTTTGGSTPPPVTGIPAPVVTPPAPGTPTGPGGSGGMPSPSQGAGWEIYVRSYKDFSTLLAYIRPGVYTGHQFVHQLNDLGSGSVTLNMDDPFWSTHLPDGNLATELLNNECMWQVALDGTVRFEFLGETVVENLVDASESRLVTVTGPGMAATLKWAIAAPEGFPNIVFKLDGIHDAFDEINASGQGVLDTNIWNSVSPVADVYITPVPQQYSYPGGTGYSVSNLYPSGTLTMAASSGTTYLGATPYDATDTLISAQISPVGAQGSSTSTNGTTVPYGAGLDGSELTQFYITDLGNSAYYAMIALSSGAFYCQVGDPSGTFTKQISTAIAYDLSNYAYWMITEQGGSGGGSGTFYFWTSPDGQNWTLQWQQVHTWNATKVGFYITAKYSTAGQTAIVSNINSNVTTPSYQGNLYLGYPAMGVWYDLMATAQARGTAKFITTTMTATADSFGRAWPDTQNVQATNGTDLYQLLQSCAAVVNADFIMQPGLLLTVGMTQPQGSGQLSVGVDRSQQIVFRAGQDLLTEQYTQARNQIANLIGAENSDGHEITASVSASITQWGQREGWFQTSAQVDPTSMEIAAAAAVGVSSGQIQSYTAAILPTAPGKRVFEDFSTGDWIGVERPDFSAVDAMRVVGIAVSVDQDGVETDELTLLSYTQWLEEQLTYIQNKMGGGFISINGLTPVAPSKYGTGQVPTYFTPAATLSNLADVVGAKGATSAAPLVYNPATGQWQAAGSASPGSTNVLGIAVASSGVAIAPDGGGTPIPIGNSTVITPSSATVAGASGSVALTPTGTTVTDSTGTPRVIVGQQMDGTVTVTNVNAPAPGVPDAPSVGAMASSLIVGWDGLLAGAAPLSDFLWAEIHMSTTTGFTPSSSTLQATMHAGGTYTIGNLTPGTTYYVKLRALNTSRVASAATAQVSGVPLAAAGGNKITFAATAPSGPSTGDVWANTSNGNELEQWNGTAWTAYQFGAGAVNFTARAIGGLAITIGATQPSSPVTNDLWYDTAAGNQMYQFNGTAWTLYQFGTGAIATGSVTASLIAANTITAAQIAAATITGAQIAANTIAATNILSGTITATQIAVGTITANLLATGIVKAGIVDSTVVTGATLQNSTTNPRTSINPDGSISITNSSGTVIFKVGPDGTIYWYNGSGVLLMETQPGGNDLIYQAAVGPQSWDFEGSTNSWAGTNATLAVDSTWSSTGADSLKITHSNTTQPWGAHSPAFAVVAGTTSSMQATLYTTAVVTGVSIGFTFWSGTNGTGTNLGTASGDQGTFTTTAGGTYEVSITGATVPATAQSATFFVQSTETTSGAIMNIDSVSIAGGLVYSNSPTGGTDSFGNTFEQGINFIGLPGLTNVFGVEDPYGSQLATIDGQGNITGQTISATADFTLSGTSLTDTLAAGAQGIVNQGVQGMPFPSTAPGSGQFGTSETALFELDFAVTAGRNYRVSLTSGIAYCNTANVRLIMAFRYTLDGSTPTTSTTTIMASGDSQVTVANVFAASPSLTGYIQPTSSGTCRVLVTGYVTSGTYYFGNTNLYLVAEDLGTETWTNNLITIGSGTSGGSSKQTWTSYYYAVHSWSYEQSGTQRSYDSTWWTGYGDSYNQSQYSYLDFSNAVSGIPSGATINWATIRLTNLHSWYNSGLSTAMQMGKTLNNGSNLSGILDQWHINEGATVTHTLSNSVINSYLLNGYPFMFFGANPFPGGTSYAYYGYYYGAAGGSLSYQPLLTVNYTA